MKQEKLSDLFFNNVLELPVWVKQVLYKKTRKNLSETLQKYFNYLNPEGLLQDQVPKITKKGMHVLNGDLSNLNDMEMIFLANVKDEYSLFDIALTNYWSLEACCKILLKLIKEECVFKLETETNMSLLEFLAGKIKTGDVLRRLGLIDASQINDALQYQKEKKDIGVKIKIADVLVNLKYVTKDDVEILIKLKEDSKRNFVMSSGLTVIKTEDDVLKKGMLENLQREHKRLSHENAILKERLKKLIEITKYYWFFCAHLFKYFFYYKIKSLWINY